jgi:hypothetical protein
VSRGTGVEDLGRGPLEGHLVQGGYEADLIPIVVLLVGGVGCCTIGEMDRGEGSVCLGLRESAEDAGAVPG